MTDADVGDAYDMRGGDSHTLLSNTVAPLLSRAVAVKSTRNVLRHGTMCPGHVGDIICAVHSSHYLHTQQISVAN